ncbi:PhoH family protein [Micavibrio aeruginosavorus]|uniref:PhoH family protein n=1 Tax=Micavibrio aeruginosavorus TaxID=349221 RepID=UPI003F4A8750
MVQGQTQGSRDTKSSGKGGGRGKGANAQTQFNEAGGASNDNANRTMTIAEAQAAVERALPAFDGGSFKLGREEITPTQAQKKIRHEAQHKDIIFVNGKAGTGKTLFSTYTALEALAKGEIDRICLATPAVTADEEIGFLPGDLNEKMMPHVRPMVETIDELIGKQLRERLMQAGVLEIAPHAFNRGRTYKYTYYLLDECQNASARQLRTSFTRIGKGSTFIYMGDDAQNDRTDQKRTAFTAYMERFSNPAYEREIGQVQIPKTDCKRHPLILKMMERGDDLPIPELEGHKEQNNTLGAVIRESAPAPQP